MIRPSSLPALKECPRFESGSTEWTDSGTNRHAALVSLLRDGDDVPLSKLPEEDQDGVRWFADYIKLKAPMSDYPISYEHRGHFIGSDFEEIFGHIDVECGPEIFDLKWRERDYTAQMAAYALIKLRTERWPIIRVHIGFAERQRVETFGITEEAARKIVDPIIERAKDLNSKPVACSYCSWCANRLTCEALLRPAAIAAEGYTDGKLQVASWHPSQVVSPDDMAKLLAIAEVVGRWSDSVKFHADKMWNIDGKEIPGCHLKESKGKRYFTDLQGAFTASGLPIEKFLKCCTARFTGSKDDPERPGLEDVFIAENRGSFPSKAAATRELNKKLQPFTARPKSKFHVATNNKQIEEQGIIDV